MNTVLAIPTANRDKSVHLNLNQSSLQLIGVSYGSNACPNGFPVRAYRKQLIPKSGQEVDPDKAGSIRSCHGVLVYSSVFPSKNSPDPQVT